MTSILHRYILVGLETDPTRYHGENPARPALLDRNTAEQVLSCLGNELMGVFPAIHDCSLTMAGALYDQSQILCPRMPVFAALETLQQTSNPGSDFQPRLLSIGASEAQMPLAGLMPVDDIPLGLLQILPILLSGPAQLVRELMTAMEDSFLERGQLAAQSAVELATHFKVTVNHARFMTITDLNALLRLQLELYGFLPLWELLDAAISARSEPLEVTTDKGLQFTWRDGAVHCFFESFDWWAQYGGGRNVPASDRQLQTAYTDWTREYRRYLSMLTAHGVKVSQHLPGLEDAELEDTFLLEESTVIAGADVFQVTEHSAGDVGTIAVTVVVGKRQINFYPLQASGLNDLQRFIREQGYAGDTACPGAICYDENSRQLIAEKLPR